MAGLIQLRSYHGATPVLSNSTNILGEPLRFKLSDTDDLYDSSIDGIVPPTDDTYVYTAVKNLQCYVPTSPEVFIGQCRIFFSNLAQDWDGIEVYVRQNATYVNPISLGNTALSGFVHNIHTFTNSNPLLVTNGNILAPSFGPFGYYVQIQMRLTKNARAGSPPPVDLHLAYSEWL